MGGFLGKIFNKKDDKVLELSIRTSAGIPFRWEYVIEDESIIELVGEKTVSLSKQKHLCGGPLNLIYSFKGLKEGETKVFFNHIYIGDERVDSTIEYNIVVDSDLKIHLKEKE